MASWPDLKDVLDGIPDRYGLVRAHWRTFPPRPGDGRFFAERMIMRLAPVAPVNDPARPWRPNAKVIHRAHPAVTVRKGNHTVDGVPLQPLRGWSPVEVLHFPWRSLDARRTQSDVHVPGDHDALTGARAGARDRSGGRHAFMVDDAALARGVADGLLVEDTRLRDALRSLAGTSEVAADAAERRFDGLRSRVPTAERRRRACICHRRGRV